MRAVKEAGSGIFASKTCDVRKGPHVWIELRRRSCCLQLLERMRKIHSSIVSIPRPFSPFNTLITHTLPKWTGISHPPALCWNSPLTLLQSQRQRAARTRHAHGEEADVAVHERTIFLDYSLMRSPAEYHLRCTATLFSAASSTVSMTSPRPSSHPRRRAAPCAASTSSSRALSALVKDSRSKMLPWLSPVVSCDKSLPPPTRNFLPSQYHPSTGPSTAAYKQPVQKRMKNMNFESRCSLG